MLERLLKYWSATSAEFGLGAGQCVEMHGQEQGIGVGQLVHPVYNLFLVIHCGQIQFSI